MDKASKTIKTFGPGQLWKAKKKKQPMKKRNYILKKSPLGSKKVSHKQPSMGVPVEARGFIYKLPAIAWSSLTMRFTGIFLTFGVSGFGLMSIVK